MGKVGANMATATGHKFTLGFRLFFHSFKPMKDVILHTLTVNLK